VRALATQVGKPRLHLGITSTIRLFVLGVYRDQLASSKTNKFGLQAIGT
jgi:hypothetical protein